MKQEVINAQRIGATFNTHILTVEKNSVDPGYSDDVLADRLRLSREIPLYSIKKTRITAMSLDTNANGKKIVIFNNDPSLYLTLSDIKSVDECFMKPTPSSVREAIIKAKNGGQKVLFTDYASLYKQVEMLNNESRQELETFVNKQLKFISTFNEANKAERLACEEALNELGLELK